MKFSQNKHLLPIILSLSTTIDTFNVTGLSFKEEDIISNTIDFKYDFSSIDNPLYNMNGPYLEYKFSLYLKKWLIETRFDSRTNEIIENKNFKLLTQMGEVIIPLILIEINKSPSRLVWALNIITGNRISDNYLTVPEACKSWVKWGIANKIISKNDLIM